MRIIIPTQDKAGVVRYVGDSLTECHPLIYIKVFQNFMFGSSGKEDCGDPEHEIVLHYKYNRVIKLASLYCNRIFQKADEANRSGLLMSF